MEVADIKKDWEGHEFDVAEFEVTAEAILEYSRAVGETDPRFCDSSNADFQAPPTFTAQFVSRRILPETFPLIRGRGFDAGKCVVIRAPVRAGDKLAAHSKIADVYQKTGRSGPMIFIVHRMEFRNQSDELVTVVDWRMVRQPDPE